MHFFEFHKRNRFNIDTNSEKKKQRQNTITNNIIRDSTKQYQNTRFLQPLLKYEPVIVRDKKKYIVHVYTYVA